MKEFLKEPDKPQEMPEEMLECLEDQKQDDFKIKNIENIFLPYCLIIPKFNEDDKLKDFLAETFRRINTAGVPLDDEELRQFMCWFYEDIQVKIYTKDVQEFEKKLKKTKTFEDAEGLLGYLAIVCDFKTRGQHVMKGYSYNFYGYVEDFLLCCAKKGHKEKWAEVNLKYIEDNQGRFKKGQEYFLKFFNQDEKEEEQNVSYQDIYLFAFIDYIYFTDKEINKNKIHQLLEFAREKMCSHLEEIEKINKNERQKYDKDPNALKRIRNRLQLAHEVVQGMQ